MEVTLSFEINEKTPDELLQYIARTSSDKKVLNAVANVCKYKGVIVWCELAKNKNLPEEAIDVFIKSKSAAIRALVPNIPGVSAKKLTALANDKEEIVRCAIAQSSKISDLVLEQYLSDPSSRVRMLAQKNLSRRNS